MAPREGPVPVVDVRHRHDPRPPARLRRLRARMERPTLEVPRLRWRSSRPEQLSAPMWVDDPDFDIDHHVRRIALPKPGTLRQLLDLASLIVLDPLDRTRPLWQFIVVEGLRGRQGGAGAEDAPHDHRRRGRRADVAAVPRLRTRRRPRDRPRRRTSDDVAAPPPPPTSASTRCATCSSGSFRLPLGLARQVRELLADPTSIPHATVAAVDTLRGVVSQLSGRERPARRCGPSARCAAASRSARAPFAATKEAAKRLGGTLNTAFLTAAAEAAGRYHIELGAAGRRAAGVDGGQHPHRDVRRQRLLARPDARADRRDAHRRALRARSSDIADAGPRRARGGASLDTLAAVAAALPTSLITRLARQQAQTVDFATSNVRAAPVPVYIAGAQLLENYPSARSPASRSTSRCCRTTAASTWASTSTPPRSPNRSGSPSSLERRVQGADLAGR